MARRWVLAALVGFALLAAATAPAALARKLPLLPLARGQISVLLGNQPYYLPVAGAPSQLTLLAGPVTRAQQGLNAYVAVQGTQQACARSAQADHGGKLTFADFFGSGSLVSAASPLAPGGGAQRGVHAAAQPVVIHQLGETQVCVWLAKQPNARTHPQSFRIVLLNGYFAASVAALSTGSPTSYAMDAVYVLRPFRYQVSPTVCGTTSSDPFSTVPVGSEANELISLGSGDCPDDSTSFSFTTPSGRSLGRLSYSDANARSRPPVVARLGACELNGVQAAPLAAAETYLTAVGCRLGRILIQPYDHSLPRGEVAMAQIDGGLAQIAPRGTAVDLVLDG